MKKLYLITSLFSILISTIAQDYNLAPMKSIYTYEKNSNQQQPYQSRSTEIFSDDFSNPSNWITDHDANDCSLDWQIGNISCVGFYPIDDIESTTADNGWAMVDSDNYGGETGGSEVEDSWLTMANPVDLSDYENVIIEFETFYRSYNYEKPFIVVGIGDGQGNVEWPTDLNPDYDESTNPNVFAAFPPGIENPTANPYKVQINISSVAGGQSEVYIRFNWTGTWGYAWFVDDFKILEQESSDIVAENAWIFEENSGGIEYGRTPLSQSAGVYEIGGTVFNFGSVDQTNVKLDVNFSGPTTISAADSIAILENDSAHTFSIQSALEFEVGLYEGIYNYSSDADNFGENNTLKRNFEITEDVYSMDGIGVHPEDELVLSSLGTASFADASDGFVCANEYLFSSRDTIKSITALITSTSPNAEVIAYVLDSVSYFTGDFGNALSMSDLYTVTEEDTANGFIEIPVIGSPWPGDGTESLIVEPGQYYVALEMNSAGNTYDIRILDDNTVGQPFWSSTIFIPGAQVYTNGNAFAIRLNLGSESTVGISENSNEYSIFPNPSSGLVFFNFDNSDEITLIIRDIAGKLISNQTVYSNAEVDFNNYGKGIYLVDVISSKGTKTEKIVIR